MVWKAFIIAPSREILKGFSASGIPILVFVKPNNIIALAIGILLEYYNIYLFR